MLHYECLRFQKENNLRGNVFFIMYLSGVFVCEAKLKPLNTTDKNEDKNKENFKINMEENRL